MFARMGAEVIKIESLDGDKSRGNGPTVQGQSARTEYNTTAAIRAHLLGVEPHQWIVTCRRLQRTLGLPPTSTELFRPIASHPGRG